jgi:hypothetical protein
MGSLNKNQVKKYILTKNIFRISIKNQIYEKFRSNKMRFFESKSQTKSYKRIES